MPKAFLKAGDESTTVSGIKQLVKPWGKWRSKPLPFLGDSLSTQTVFGAPHSSAQMNSLNKMSFSVTRYVIYNMFPMENMKHPYLNCPASCNNCKSWNKQTNKTKPRKQDCCCQETWSIKKVPRNPLKTTKSNRSAELESYDQYKNPLYLSALTLNIQKDIKAILFIVPLKTTKSGLGCRSIVECLPSCSSLG